MMIRLIATLSLTLGLLVGVTTPCPAEDSNACTWDATTRGNGEGRSFTSLAGGWVIYH